MDVEFDMKTSAVLFAIFIVRPVLHKKIQDLHIQEPLIVEIINRVKQGKSVEIVIQPEGTLMIGHRLCLDVENLRREMTYRASDKVFARVLPLKEVIKFGKKEKLRT